MEETHNFALEGQKLSLNRLSACKNLDDLSIEVYSSIYYLAYDAVAEHRAKGTPLSVVLADVTASIQLIAEKALESNEQSAE